VVANQFNAWQKKYNKNLTGSERAKALKAFYTTVQSVYAANADPTIPFVVTVNGVRGDMTYQQFKSSILIKRASFANKTDSSSYGRRSLIVSADKLPSSVDWRKKGVVPAIRNQGQCGSCWTFSATGAVEIMYNIVNGPSAPPIDLSEQQVLDCCNEANGFSGDGCDGGNENIAINYIYHMSQTTEARYPYTSGDSTIAGSCSFKPINGQVVQPSTNFVTILPPPEGVTPEQALMSALTVGPVTAVFNVLDKFSLFANGIYDPAVECNKKDKIPNHAMVTVGYDTTGPIPYWTVRNSWAASWAENGYVRIKMTNTAEWPYGPCGMYTWAWQVAPSFIKKLGTINNSSVVEASPSPPPPPPSPPCYTAYLPELDRFRLGLNLV